MGARDAKAAQEPPSLYRSGTQVRPRPGAPRVPQDVSAVSWLVADADSGAVLAAHDAHRKLPPTSTLKTLFALTVLPGLPAGLRHTVEAEELAGIGAGSSLVGIKEDLTYRVADLWRGVFLSSGNDAVRVLAALNGGWRATAEQMQDKARSLGARDTHVVSPDGYDAPGQVSSAYDLAVFGRAGLRNAEFAEYCATATAQFPAGGWSYGIQNTNRLLTGAADRALSGTHRRQERLHQQRGQHPDRRREARWAHPRRDGAASAVRQRLRRLRGGALPSRLGFPCRRARRGRGLAAAAAPGGWASGRPRVTARP